MPSLRLLLVAVVLVLAQFGMPPGASHAQAARGFVVVPPGNRSPTQPPISFSSLARTSETGGNFEAKFKRVYASLADDKVLIAKIKSAAATYGIDPIHIIGALVGEHTYNVDAVDNMQTYYVKALEYLGTNITFAYKGETIEHFVARPEFNRCDDSKSDYGLWTCRLGVWRTVFKGKTVGGVHFPDDRLERVFFQPFFAGQTFGLGQLNPLTALMVTDMVHKRSGLPKLDMRRAPEVYHAVMDPDVSLQYIAAVIRQEIDIYRDVAGFDISHNPGITATLYNLGDVMDRARKLAAVNGHRRASGGGVVYPRENYYGWLINARLATLKKLL